MAVRVKPVDPRHPPPELDALVDWFGRLSDDLVLLEDHPLESIRGAVEAVGVAVVAHCRIDPAVVSVPTDRTAPRGVRLEALRADHRRFPESVAQLGWFLAVVEREDHGGHRQALGQYGRVFVESFRRHREEERVLSATSRKPGGPFPSAARLGKP